MTRLLSLLVMVFAAFGLGAFVATMPFAAVAALGPLIGLGLVMLVLLVIWDGPP